MFCNIMRVLFLAIFVTSIVAQPNNFDYKQHGSDWDGDCTDKDSNMQSPILLDQNSSNQSNSFLIGDFKSISGDINFLNTTVYIKVSDSSQVFGEIYTKTVDKKAARFKASQIRFRSQSQHRVGQDQKAYDLQLQVFLREVYGSTKNLKLAVGIFFEVGEKEDPFLAEVLKANKQQSKSLNVDLSHLLKKQNNVDFWFYLGSSTIPSCTNGKLYWVIPKKAFSMSQQQRDFFYSMFHDQKKGISGNWRKVQSTQKNQVNMYKTFQMIDL